MKKITSLMAFLMLSLVTFSQSFYDLDSVQTIRITFAQSNWDALLDAEKASTENYILATSVSLNGVVYDSVGVKYKGNSTYRSTQVKNPFHIELDTYKDHKHENYTDIKLSNVANDPSFVREVLSYQVARQYMDAPLSNYANVYVNNQLIGLYSNSEAISKKFVDSRFGSKKNTFVKCNPPAGAGPGTSDYPNLVYLGTDSTNYYAKYEIKSDFGWEELIHLCDTLNNHTTAIEDILDVDRTLWMHAFNNVLVNLDSYSGGFTQNYYLYRGSDGRFIPIVWDLNESFGSFTMTGSGNLNGTTGAQQMSHLLHQTDAAFPLISKLLAIPTYKKMYLAHVKTMLQDNFKTNGAYYAVGQALQATINSDVQADQNKFYTYANFTSNLTSDVSTGGGPGGGRSKPGITNLMNGRNAYLMGLGDFTAAEPAITTITVSDTLPTIGDTINITANVLNETSVFLRYRTNIGGIAFEKVSMFDDGLHNDGAANDDVYGADVIIDGGFLEYYIYAENSTIGKFSPTNAEHEFYSLFAQAQAVGDIVINEFMASNNSAVADQDGEFDDWIEIYNKGSVAIALDNYRLTDDASDFSLFAFPSGTTIQPNQYLVVWADKGLTQTGFHADFKLSSNGETILLTDSNLAIVDSITYGSQVSDSSFGRLPNGTGSFVQMSQTIGSQNGVVPVVSSNIVINEFLASNTTTQADANGEFDDWIELYNKGNTAVDISGYHLTDDALDFSVFSFPVGTMLNPNSYLIVWADGDSAQAGFHADFKLSAGGETLYLSNSMSAIIDSIAFGSQTTDVSFGRFPNGSGNFQTMTPTFSGQNILGSVASGDLVINEFLASNVTIKADQDGEFDDWIELYNKGNDTLDLGVYTLSDEASGLNKFTFPAGTTLMPDSFVIVWADGDVTQAGFHANFDLSNGGETIYLADTSGNSIDSVVFGAQTTDISFGRFPNGTGNFQTMNPTFRASNKIVKVPTNDLVINELLASNSMTIADQDGEFDDWIELFNKGNTTIDLSVYSLSDDASALNTFTFPAGTMLMPDSFIVVWADGDTAQIGFHADFKLSAGGETLYLSNANGIADSVLFGAQATDISYGRFPNGTGSFMRMTPTFGATNINSTGLNKLSISKEDISMYPNPAENFFTIEVNSDGSIERELAIYNVNGKLVHAASINQMVTVDSKSWTAGLYFVRIGEVTSKILIK